MTLEQTEQLVSWLDEEHRKDKAKIAELSEQLTQQFSQIAGVIYPYVVVPWQSAAFVELQSGRGRKAMSYSQGIQAFVC